MKYFTLIVDIFTLQTVTVKEIQLKVFEEYKKEHHLVLNTSVSMAFCIWLFHVILSMFFFGSSICHFSFLRTVFV